MTKDEVLKLALEALEFDSFYGTKKQDAITAIKEALAQPEQKPEHVTYAGNGTAGFLEGERPTGFFIQADRRQPEQEPNKDGSPCPEFWDWLPKAYNFDGNGAFTKYNMEVAFLAGKQASQPEQEPVAYPEGDVVGPCICGSWPGGKCLKCPRITTPPQRTWQGLTDEDLEAEFGFIDELLRDTCYRTEAKFKEKNT